VTNAEFSPAALKLLEPFDDFRRTAYNALTFYEFNTKKVPLDDRRIRQALALAIDREKLTESELQGTTRPADSFAPSGPVVERRLTIDIARAEDLMKEAGFPDGNGFPKLRLVVVRNDTQQRVAAAVAQMWKQHLNVETEIVVREAAELDQVRLSGDYDIIRRNVVLPTTDETASMISLFGMPEAASTTVSDPIPTPIGDQSSGQISGPSAEEPQAVATRAPAPILTNDDALYEVRAIPLFYPTSYFLVKPYVKGFEGNSLDARSLKSVEIDANWRTR
jgi:ABC-type transport system substrate-binding protein